MHTIYGYMRAVHATYKDRWHDLETQTNAIHSYAKKLIENDSRLKMGEIFSDVGLIRRAQTIRGLPAGQQLLLKIRKRDHLVIGHFGRAFPTVRDCLWNLRLWKHQGIILHLAQRNLRMNMNSTGGQLFVKILMELDDAVTVSRRELLKGHRAAKTCNRQPATGPHNLSPSPYGLRRRSRRSTNRSV